ncbi:MAG: tetratricopeptide repeat protein, partial [Chlamydiia bacterium]|nr:tetratricopeptide repeat protein [Chlamydiia bacterium]
IEYLKKSVELLPAYFDGWSALAEAYSQLYINSLDEQYVQKASDAFSAAVKTAPSSSAELQAECWLSWAQILAESGRANEDSKALRESIEKCARAFALDTKNPLITAQWVEALSYLGYITSRLDLLLEAENKALKAADEFPDDPDLWHAYGVCLMQLARYYSDTDYFEMAIEKLQYGLSIDRSSAEHWHTLGLCHKLYADVTQDADLLERANRFLTKAIDLKPACPALLFDAARSMLHFSEVMGDIATLESSLYYFETLMQASKDALIHHPEWLFEYGCASALLAEYTHESSPYYRAIEVFSHVLLVDPDFASIHYRIAMCYFELGQLEADAEFYKRAIHFFKLAARQEEEDEQVWLDWGICLIHLAHHTLDTETMHQHYWDAEQKIAHAGTLGHHNAYYNLACLYSILGRTSEAMDFIRKALTARALPAIDEMVEDDWLDNLRSTPAFAQFLSALEAKLHQTREE